MGSLYLLDIITKAGLEPKNIKLIRHSLNHKRFKASYETGYFEEYQKFQRENFFKGCDYILSFVSGPGTSAKFLGCFKVGSGQKAAVQHIPSDSLLRDMYEDEESYYFDLQKMEYLSDLDGRLIINWGKSTVSWHQWATNEKEVLAIQENPKYAFAGFENIVLSFSDLSEIVTDPTLYENWHTALSSVYAIYLITDRVNGKQYVGSAYGTGGLLSRWKNYVETHHGGNKRIVELLQQQKERYVEFQFSVLQIIPKSFTSEDVIALESLYKRKLKSIDFGLNDN